MKLPIVASIVSALLLSTAPVVAQSAPPLPLDRAASLSEPVLNALLPKNWSFLRVGTWNTMLRTWQPYESKVIKAVGKTNFDVLALQSVWSEGAKNAILADRDVKAKYKHHFWIPPSTVAAECSSIVPFTDQASFINCYQQNEIDTQTIVQPEVPVPFSCTLFGLNIALLSQPCLDCLISTMEGLPSEDPLSSIQICAAGNGVKYTSGGTPGLLILSKKPLQNVQTVSFPTSLQAAANVYATVNNVRLAFSTFPKNTLEEIDPILGELQDGALQDDFAEDLLLKKPKLALGTFNSGADYQPEGSQLLKQNNYKPLYNKPTYCPAKTHARFPPCTVAFAPEPRSIDDIYVSKSGVFCLTSTFAEEAVSDHIGVSAICLVNTK
ncbi:MAG: hypothetical protein ABW352_16390 [Polyangiales bacterium]